MNVSAWFIRNPIASVMLFVLLCFGGLLGFAGMKIQSVPDIDFPVVTVTASLEGASPDQLENDVARKIEDSISGIQGLKHIYTTIQDSNVLITTEFRLEKPIQEALDDVRSAVNNIRTDLPADLPDPTVTRVDLMEQPIYAFVLQSDSMDEEALSWFIDHEITKRLLLIKGVGEVTRVGGVDREVRVSLDPIKLQAWGVTAAEISQQLKQVQTEISGGRTQIGQTEQPMRTLGTIHSASELRSMELALSDGKRIALTSVAEIEDRAAEKRSMAFLNGQEAIAFEVSRSRGQSEVDVGAAVKGALAQLLAEHPDVRMTQAYDYVSPILEEYDGSMHLLYEGAILAILVVWLFLHSFRATFISAIALPLSIIPAFLGMYLLNSSLNVITLLALSLVVGILVDDAIVEVENIVRHIRTGKKPYEAAIEAADEIGLAVIATTFTLIAVFLPTAFLAGTAGLFFKQFGWAASLAVFCSLVVARALTPMMAAYLMKPLPEAQKDPRWIVCYLGVVGWCLRHRWITVCVAAGLFVGSIMLLPLISQAYSSGDDSSQTQVYIELPPGTRIEETARAAEKARQLIANTGFAQTIYTAIGGGSAGADPLAASVDGAVNKACLTITLPARGSRPDKITIEKKIREELHQIPGVRFKVGLGNSGEKYTLAITSEDPTALRDAALVVEREIRTIPGLGNVSSSASLIRPEIVVRPNFAKAAEMGVTSAQIGETLRVATIGDYDMYLAKMNLPQRQVPIVVRLKDSARTDLDTIRRLNIVGTKGAVMLSDIASVTIEGGPSVITRYDRARNINFEVELADLPMGDVSAAVSQLPSVNHLPPGVHIMETGDVEIMIEMFQSFAVAILTGIVCIYVVLVLLFKDFLQPLTILVALPLSLGGAFVALLTCGMGFSMSSLIGLLMLMGIATKNSILLVEYAVVARKTSGIQRFEALMSACHKRVRPIIMTTIAMSAGMLPIALGMGNADPSFRSPMAIAVIGGLISSTILSLLVIPAVFTVVDDFENLLRRCWKKIKTIVQGKSS